MSLANQKALDSTFVMPTFGRSQVEFVRGDGMYLYDSEGKKYLDFLAGIAVCSLGHVHPAITAALGDQAAKLVHVSNYFYIEHRGEVAALLSKLANDDMAGATAVADAIAAGDEDAAVAAAEPAEGEQVWQTFFANSGAEANEGAMKLARLYAKRNGNGGNTIVCLKGSFHGRTLTTLAATMQDWAQKDYQPLPVDFVACEVNDVDQLKAIFEQYGSQICAFMFEPIQGESGVHPLTQEFVDAAAELVHGVGGLLLADEVQTGVFRTGKPFGFQTYGVEADIFSMAKGIAGGMPVGAVVAKKEIAQTFKPGDHGSTFGGSNLAVACAAAVLAELTRGNYGEHATELGAYFAEQLATLPHVKEVRGKGLILGCDLEDEVGDAHELYNKALEAGLIFSATGPHTLRFVPPLVAQKEHVDELIEGLRKLLA